MPQKVKGERKREKERRKQNPANYKPSLQTSIKSSVTCGMAECYPLEVAKPGAKPRNQWPGSQEVVGSSVQADSLAD